MPETKVVIDASAWLSVIFNEDGSEYITELVRSSEWFAPEWILIEAANGISRKSKYTPKERMEFIQQIRADPFHRVPLETWFDAAAQFAIKYDKLSFYDAAYIAAAKELNAPLLTEDSEMQKVMLKEEVNSLL